MKEINKTSAVEPSLDSVSEYKIGHTTYVVTTKFDFSGERLEDLLKRLIFRDIEKTAA